MLACSPVTHVACRRTAAIFTGATTGPAVCAAALARPVAAGIATLVLAFLCGCGSSSNGVASKSPADILATATSAAQQASSVHIQANSANGALTLTLDMSYTKNGAHGSVSLFGLDYQLIRIGDTLYVSGNSRFYRELAQTLSGHAATAVAKLPARHLAEGHGRQGSLSGLAAITEMDSELALILGRGTPVAKGAETSVNGQQAIELKQTAKLYNGSLFIATTGKPYPILERKTGRETRPDHLQRLEPARHAHRARESDRHQPARTRSVGPPDRDGVAAGSSAARGQCAARVRSCSGRCRFNTPSAPS